MKNYLIILSILFLSSCGITRKVIEDEQEKSVVNDTITSDVSNVRSLFIDTTNTLNLKIEYKKIEYFAPSDTSTNKPVSKPQIKSVTTYTINRDSTKKGIKKDTVSIITSDSSIIHENKEIISSSANISRPNVFAQFKWIFLFVAIILFLFLIFKILKKYKLI